MQAHVLTCDRDNCDKMNRALGKPAGDSFCQLKKAAVPRMEQDAFSLARDPLTQVTCRIGDASCASAHASTLNSATGAQPSRSGQSLLRWQRRHGNRYVQRCWPWPGKVEAKQELALKWNRPFSGPVVMGKRWTAMCAPRWRRPLAPTSPASGCTPTPELTRLPARYTPAPLPLAKTSSPARRV